MKKINILISKILILLIFFNCFSLHSTAAENKEEYVITHFFVNIKAEYFSEIENILSEIEDANIENVRELTNPADFSEPYAAIILVNVKEPNEETFAEAQKYFLKKEYVESIRNDVLIIESKLLFGDVNLDGKITAEDARSILRFSVKLEKPSNYEIFSLADMNEDTEITALDARIALRISVGLEDFRVFSRNS